MRAVATLRPAGRARWRILLILVLASCAGAGEARGEPPAAPSVVPGGFVAVDDLPAGAEVITVPCPVRLRLRLPPQYTDRVWRSTKTAAVECDGVSMPAVEIVFRELRSGSGWMDVKPEIAVGEPRARVVAVELAVELAGHRVSTASREDLAAAEGRARKKGLTLTLAPETLRTWRLGTVAVLEIVLQPVEG
jgi:hypothetical protein